MAQIFTSCMKVLFLIFNLVFWISGLALLVAGCLAKFQYAYLLKLSKDINYNLAPYIMIGCGVFIIIVGFIGCWAAVKEHSWALKLYMFILVVLVVVEIAGAIAGYVMKGKISNGLKSGMEAAVNNYYTDNDYKNAMDEVQGKIVKCCGVSSYKDYKTTKNGTNLNGTRYEVPKSCCEVKTGCKSTPQIITDSDSNLGFYNQGCYNVLVTQTTSKFKIFGGVALGIAVFQILGIVCAYFLTRQFNSSYETM